MIRGAEISECGLYRYSLWRIWNQLKPTVLFIGLNPSTADAQFDDRTIGRCVGFGQSWGFGGLIMANLFAFRATHPPDMKKAADPIGPRNDETLRRLATESTLIIAAWGKDGDFMGRDAVVRAMMPQMSCLMLTKAGQPYHPLYVPAEKQPMPFGVTDVKDIPIRNSDRPDPVPQRHLFDHDGTG